jgi:CHAD domain-containing protein
MAFRFKRKETVSKAVRRLCCERIDAALGVLSQKNHFEAAHGVRKEIKKMRSVLRLARNDLGDTPYRKSNDALREAAARLTEVRDAHVRLDALNELASHPNGAPLPPAFPKLKIALQKNCDAALRKLENGKSLQAVERILRQTKKRIANVDLSGKAWPIIAAGLGKSYRRGREDFYTIGDEPSAGNFHAWRKRVKDLYHQVRLLRPVRSDEVNAEVAKLEQLGALLGRDHDLFMLQEFAVRNADSAETQALIGLISRSQKELRKAALKLGRDFYAEKPSVYCRRMESYWKDWRGNG